ncbi:MULTISPECIES: hypothetical protein [unclassified Mameliella]|uniref:hypothetical protein n=1 Tax=unclassified Mameliella TaxID=2630630 RepID=UPI00273F6312|nr:MULTISPECIES: hypothetical protein [unclassified Mameliella]
MRDTFDFPDPQPMPPVICEMLDAGALFSVNHSAGKDSQAMLITLRRMGVARMLEAGRPLERLDAVLRDTDFETIKEEASQSQKLNGGTVAGHGTDRLLVRVNKGLREKVT